MANAISDVAGETEHKILRASVAGERDALTLAKGKKRGRARNAPKFDLRTQRFQLFGVHLTRMDGIDVTTALVVVGELSADMGKFPSDKHFAPGLVLCPGTKTTGSY